MALPKGSAAFTTAEATVQTVFQGTTLRSMLLNAYGWWQMGQIALIASIVSFVLAGVTLLLSGLGLWHSRRVPAEEEIPNFGPPPPPRSWPPAPRRPTCRPIRPLRTGAPAWEQPSRGTGASGQDRTGETLRQTVFGGPLQAEAPWAKPERGPRDRAVGGALSSAWSD